MHSTEYERINWQDEPSKSTPISADNLNKMDRAIYEHYQDIKSIHQALPFSFGISQDGEYGYINEDGSFVPFKRGSIVDDSNLYATFWATGDGQYKETNTITVNINIVRGRYVLVFNAFQFEANCASDFCADLIDDDFVPFWPNGIGLVEQISKDTYIVDVYANNEYELDISWQSQTNGTAFLYIKVYEQ